MTEGHTQRLDAALGGRYRIERKLGEGGMATVYLAEDIKHERKVALKILRPELAAVIGAERFLSEIKTTANLQHPHILPLFDSGEAESYLYYVMPFIDGETLRDRIEREGQLGVDEAVKIAREVADALDYAHRNDVIHRDIKPANILLHDGRPVVADFGIALAISAAGGGRMTETGLSLGTPHYMSPEQASADRDLSARSDVYSLGCVLYEMLAGQPPHTGPSAQSILVRILTEDPRDVLEMRRTVPPHIAATVMKSIEKLPADRFDSAKEFMEALGDEGFTHASVPRAPRTTIGHAVAQPAATPKTLVRGLAAAVVVLAGVAAWGWLRPPEPAPVRRMTMVIENARGEFGPAAVISPDGSRIVYAGGSGLLLRSLQSLESRPIPETEGGRTPFFSPDGTRIGFHTGTFDVGRLSTVSISDEGAPPVEVAEGSVFAGGAWSDDGFIYFADGPGALLRVAEESSGVREVVADSSSGYGFVWPEALPGGEHVLVSIFPIAGVGETGLAVVNTRTGSVTPILRDLTGAQRPMMGRYAGGYLFWRTENRTLMAGRFDLGSFQLTSSPVALSSGVADAGGGGSAEFDVSDDGTLLYALAEGSGVGLGESMTWVSLQGAPEQVDERLLSDIGDLDFVALSPDGRRIAAEVQEGTDGTPEETHQIWVYDRDQSTFVRLTLDGRMNKQPRWLDNQTVVYVTTPLDGPNTIEALSIDGGAPEVLFSIDREISDFDVSTPGGPLAVTLFGDANGTPEIVVVDPSGGGEPTPIVSSRFNEAGADLSPDGRWLAYVSDESGRPEVYVRAFPEGDRRSAISISGGVGPRWSPSGDALFYRGEAGTMTVADLSVGERVSVEERRALFDLLPFESVSGGGGVVGSFDVIDSGLLMVMEARGAARQNRVIVFNVFQELKERIGR